MSLQGKAALVAGTASGLGSATTRTLVEAGAKVAAFDRDAARAGALGEPGAGRTGRLQCEQGRREGLTLPVARDLAPLAIRVVSIAPGVFATPMIAGMSEQVQQSLFERTLLYPPRVGDPAEFGALVRHIIENPRLNGRGADAGEGMAAEAALVGAPDIPAALPLGSRRA